MTLVELDDLNNYDEIRDENINDLIDKYMAFIVKTISSITGRYVSLENDEELSIGLLAFKEAVDKYDESRGSFSSFARLVISSRIKNFINKENKHSSVYSLDEMTDAGIEISDKYDNPIEDKTELINEIIKLKSEIEGFGFSFEQLVEEAPKHEDTRNNAIDISEKVSKEDTLTSFMFNKKRLPIKQITLKFSVTEKIIKRSKKFIISVVIIICRDFRNLKLWIRR